MKKKDLEEKSELSHYTLIKMSRDENVTTEVLGKIWNVFECKVEDFMEFIIDYENETSLRDTIINRIEL